MSDPVLKLDDLTKVYNPGTPGEVNVLRGASGSRAGSTKGRSNSVAEWPNSSLDKRLITDIMSSTWDSR